MKTQNIKAAEIHKFIKDTHKENLANIKSSLAKGEWHWLLPESWCNNERNKELIFHSINATQLLGTK